MDEQPAPHITALKPAKGARQHAINIGGGLSPLILVFCVIVLLAYLADAIMSYTSPVFIEDNLGSSIFMGLVLSTSSVVGIVSDIILGGWFRSKGFGFFTRWAFICAILFPVIYLVFPPALPSFFAAMAIWGVYYELNQFSNYHFVESHSRTNQHVFIWGILSTFKSTAYTFGPLIASLAYDRDPKLPFYLALGLNVVGLGAITMFTRVFHSKRKAIIPQVETKRSIVQELKIWGILSTKVWHLFLFVFMLSLVDATFWSVGAVLSEELQNSGEHGLLLVLYGLPALFLGVLAGRAARPFGKKRAAFGLSIIGGVVLTMVGLVNDENLLLGLVFLASCFFAVSWPEIYAVFEDYVCRLGKTGNDFIGLQSSIVGLSYVIGPIFAGAVASIVGHQATFAVVGIMLTVVSIIVLLITPRKIKLPQAKLKDM